jgi:hypothetical protein
MDLSVDHRRIGVHNVEEHEHRDVYIISIRASWSASETGTSVGLIV